MIWRRKKPPPPVQEQAQERILVFPADILADFLIVDAANEITNLGSIARFDLAISAGAPDTFHAVHKQLGGRSFSIRPPDGPLVNPLTECWTEITDPESPPNTGWLMVRALCATLIWRQSGQPARVKIALDADMPAAQQVVLAAMFEATEGATIIDTSSGKEIPISFGEIL